MYFMINCKGAKCQGANSFNWTPDTYSGYEYIYKYIQYNDLYIFYD